jgi:hypothetical protein
MDDPYAQCRGHSRAGPRSRAGGHRHQPCLSRPRRVRRTRRRPQPAGGVPRLCTRTLARTMARDLFPISPLLQSATLFANFYHSCNLTLAIVCSSLHKLSGLLRFGNVFVDAPDSVFHCSTAGCRMNDSPRQWARARIAAHVVFYWMTPSSALAYLACSGERTCRHSRSTILGKCWTCAQITHMYRGYMRMPQGSMIFCAFASLLSMKLSTLLASTSSRSG